MDGKTNIMQNCQMFNQINDIPDQNAYNLLYQNRLQIAQEFDSQKMYESQNYISAQNKAENNKEEEPIPLPQKKIRKRTTKKESDIRNYKCSLCDKSYLSYPALYTHCKQKHNTNNHSGRGRGRPKKEQNEIDIEKDKYNPLTVDYFLKEEKTGKTPVENINECAKKAFNYLYNNQDEPDNIKKKIKERKMKEYSKIKEHPFLGNFINDLHDINKILVGEKIPTDFVLINYLNKMSNYCNENFYEKLIIFVVLFREHINIINEDKADENKEFTQTKEAEDVPESSNEFLTDFLFPEEQDFEFCFSKDEAIELTRNLCNWMYENNFTCSKLFLL